MSEPQAIHKALIEVMKDVGAVRKAEFNSHQKFPFRGIDAVINAVSPAFRQHGVFCTPTVLESIYESVQVGQNRTTMGHARITVQYTFYAHDGSSVSATVSAESMDSGDKATAKAFSVAYRTALLQTLCLPTDEQDPDAQTYERSAPQERAPQQRTAPSQSNTAAPASGGKPITAPQITLVNNLLEQAQCDEQLIIDTFNKSIDQLSVQEAKGVIAKLIALNKGEAEVIINGDGVAVIQ